MKLCPPKPGFTLIISTRSSLSSSHSSASSDDEGLNTSPALQPAALMSCSVRSTCAPASGWKLIRSAPASAKACASASTGCTIRWTSIGTRLPSAPHRMLAQRLADHRAEGQVRHEVVVHHVEVDPVGAGGDHVAHLFAEAGEVGGQQAGGDQGFGHGGLASYRQGHSGRAAARCSHNAPMPKPEFTCTRQRAPPARAVAARGRRACVRLHGDDPQHRRRRRPADRPAAGSSRTPTARSKRCAASASSATSRCSSPARSSSTRAGRAWTRPAARCGHLLLHDRGRPTVRSADRRVRPGARLRLALRGCADTMSGPQACDA